MMEKYRPIGSRIGRAEKVGMEFLKNGKVRQKAEYRVYMPTRNGEIEINRWRELAKEAVKADGKTELFERIMDYIKDYGWLKKIPDREEWALSCMYYGSYMFWEGFEVIWM